MRTRPAVAIFACTLAACLFSCSNQGEGERCDTRANDDCAGGLLCTPFNELNSAGLQPVDGFGICCPPKGTPSRAVYCQQPIGAGLGDASTFVSSDASAPSDAGRDAPGD